MTVTPIPLATLPIGDTVVGPVTVAAGLQSGVLTIDRTVAGGLNSLTNASEFTFTWDQSLDSGVTFQNRAITHAVGGVIIKNGITQTTDVTGMTLAGDGPGREVRLTITVSGPSAIAASGSLTTTP